MVVATLWSIWLARNDLVFNQIRLKKETLQDLIFLRVSKWGKAIKVIFFDSLPLWRVNPVGTLHVHHYLDKSKFWLIRRENFSFTCMVDAA